MVKKSKNNLHHKSSSVLIIHTKNLIGDLSKVISLATEPEKITEIKIVLPSLKFMNALMELDTDNKSIEIVTDAWSIGIATSIMVHQKLIPLLSSDKLVNLPVTLEDHKGFTISVLCKKVISYADVAVLKNSWLLVTKNIVVSDFALEHMQKNNLFLVK